MKKQNIFLFATMALMLLSASLFSQIPLVPDYAIAKIIISGQDYFDFAPGETMAVKFYASNGTVDVDDDPDLQAPYWYVFSSPSTSSLNYVTASGHAYNGGYGYRLVIDNIVEEEPLLIYIYAHWTNSSISIPDPDPID
jgi:hypothetical protein